MARHCTLEFNNPVTGQRHPSLVGYLLNQYGISEDEIQDTLDQGFIYTKVNGTKTWGDQVSESPYIEPNILSVTSMLGMEVAPELKNYLGKVQRFYNEKNLSVGTELNVSQIRQIVKDALGQGVMLELEVVNPEAEVSERRYKLYPMPESEENSYLIQNSVFKEVDTYYQESGKPGLVKNLSKYVDVLNPNIYNVVRNMLQDETLQPYERQLINTLIKLMDLNPDIKLDLSYNPDYEVGASGSILPTQGKYDLTTNSITLFPHSLYGKSDQEIRNLILHEIVHSVTVSVLENPQTVEERVFASEIKRIWEYYREKYKDVDPIASFYGLKDQHEFVSEFLTNPLFRDNLAEVAPEVHGSVFQSILNFLKKLITLDFRKQNKRVDNAYIEEVMNDFFENVLDNNQLNTSLTYTPSRAFHSQGNSKDYEQFIETLPGTPGQEVDMFMLNLRNFLDSDAVNWSAVYQHANNQGLNVYGFESALNKLNDLDLTEIPLADLKKSFESVLEHLRETTLFLRALNNDLAKAQTSKALSPRDLYSRSYHAANIGKFFLEYQKKFKEAMFAETMPPPDTAIPKFLSNIEALSNALIKQLSVNQAKAVAGVLTESLYEQTQTIRQDLESNIKRLEQEKANAKTDKLKRVIDKKLTEERERLSIIATPENLEKALLGRLTLGPKSKSGKILSYYLGSLFESAAISGDLVAGTLDTFINNLHSKSTQEALAFQGAMKNLADELQAHLSKKGIKFNTGLDHNAVFMPFLRKVKVVEIKRGQLVERETFVLQSKMDEIGYMNDWTRKKYEINKLDTRSRTPEQELEYQRLVQELTDFEEEHLQSYYTEEYFRIQNLLSPKAKELRDDIINQMRKIQISPQQGDNVEEDLDKLEELKRQLDALEQDTDEYGVMKSEEMLEVARNIREWKDARGPNGAKLFKYEVTEKNLAIFNSRYDALKDEVADAGDQLTAAQATGDTQQIQVSQAKFNKAQKDLDAFKRANVVKKIKPEFYIKRGEILDAIAEIQRQYTPEREGRTISDVYRELFSLLKPYKNSDGEYEGTKIIDEFQEYEDENGNIVRMNIPIRVKQLQEEIEAIKEELDSMVKISPEDKAALRDLYAELNSMQERTTTKDYLKAFNAQFNISRAQILEKNPNAFVGKTEEEINRSIDRHLKQSEWYKLNHIKVPKFNQVTRQYQMVNTPLFHWQVTLPTDPAYISETEPSFRWYTVSVSDEIDPATGRPRFINPEVKNARNSKRVLLKPTSTYTNNSYGDNLDDVERDILARVTDLYESRQKPLPRNLKKGLELPSVRKEGLESAREFLTGTAVSIMEDGWSGLKNSIVNNNLIDNLTGKNEDDLAEGDSLLGKGGSQINQYKNRLHLKYVTPIEADKMTVNFMNSITQFGSDAIRFQNLYSNLPYILGARDLIETNLKGTTAARMVNNLLERKLNGQGKVSLTNIPLLNAIGYISDSALGLGASMGLSLNLPSSLKNFAAGSTNLYVQLNRFGVEKKDIHSSMFKNAKEYLNLLSAEIEEGKNSPYMVKMKYFGVMPEDTLTDGGRKIFVTNLSRSAKYNPLKHLSFFREFGEFEMRSAVAEALSKQHLIKLKNGTYVPILEAYEVVGNVMIPLSTIENLDAFAAQEQHYRNRLNAINALIHGAYGAMDKAEYSRYSIGRLLMYMKGWFGYQWLSRFGSRRMAYSAGMEFEGMYRTVYHAARMLFQTNGNFAATGKLLSSMEKDNLISAALDTTAIATLMALGNLLAAAVYSDDDDDQDNLPTYWLLFNVLYLEDELSSLHPITGSYAMYYSRVVNNVDGKDAFTYYFNKNVLYPYRGVWDILESTWNFASSDELNLFDEYVPRSKAGRVLNPKRYQPDPFLQGQPEIIARLNKMWALNNSVNYLYGGSEFMYRKYEYTNPKWFVSSYGDDKRQARKGVDAAKKEIKSIEAEMSYIDDPETIMSLQERINTLRDVIKTGEEKTELLKGEFEMMDRK